MLRIILGIVVGFVVWTILWIGSDAILAMLLPFYKENIEGFQKALETKEPFQVSSGTLLISLARSFIFSIIAGYVTASIARENTMSTLGLGTLLLAFGIFIQSVYWNYIPLWYHIPFLLLLIPMTFLGGKLRKIQQ